jgi:lipoate-protein ligase A
MRLWFDRVPRPGWLNMAIDSALLERAERGERWLRLYAWSPSCLSFGRHEPALRRYDVGRIAALGLAVVRRPTGGRAVWHAGELTYAIAAPWLGLGTLRQAYETIHLMLRDALRSLGAAAELAPRQPAAPLGAGACFAAPGGGEVTVHGGKVVGSAQCRHGAGLLQHGSVLLDHDQSVVATVTCGDDGPATRDGSLPLDRALGRRVDWEEAATAVAGAARRCWALSSHPPDPSPLLERALRLGDRFRSDEWTWSGAPAR